MASNIWQAPASGAVVAALLYDGVRVLNFTASAALAAGANVTYSAHGRFGLNTAGEAQSTWGNVSSGAHTLTLVSDPDGATPVDVATATIRYCNVESSPCECGSEAAVSALSVGPAGAARTWAWGTAGGTNLALYPSDTALDAGGAGRVVPLRVAVSVGPASYCPPRHRMPFSSRKRVQSVLDDVASSIWQALSVGDVGLRGGARGGGEHHPPGRAWQMLLATS